MSFAITESQTAYNLFSSHIQINLRRLAEWNLIEMGLVQAFWLVPMMNVEVEATSFHIRIRTAI